jgi:acetyltransferase-like isoleucine patch superfamily enzyme
MTEPTAQNPPDWHHLPGNRFTPHTWILGEPSIGEGCWIGAFAVIDGSGGLTIGKGCDIGACSQIYTHSTVRRVLSKREIPIERMSTSIGDYVHIAPNVTILMGCQIGNHVSIGAGAVLRQGMIVPDWSLVIGVPARIIPDGARRFVETVTSG